MIFSGKPQMVQNHLYLLDELFDGEWSHRDASISMWTKRHFARECWEEASLVQHGRNGTFFDFLESFF
jgi:hypothetical protein